MLQYIKSKKSTIFAKYNIIFNSDSGAGTDIY